MTIEVQIHRDFMHGGFSLLIMDETGSYSVAGGRLMHVPVEPGEEIKPALSINHTERAVLQGLADALAAIGVMPKTGDNAKELTATRAHLSDMQRMANRAFDMLTFNPVVTAKDLTK